MAPENPGPPWERGDEDPRPGGREGRWKRRGSARSERRGRSGPVFPALRGRSGLRGGVVGGHWRAERRTISVGIVAHGFSALTGLAAGVMLVSITGTLERLPGFLLLLPAAIGMRGNIFGAMGSRLGTALNLGTFELRIGRDSVLGQDLVSVGLLTLSTSALLAVVARGVNLLLGRSSMSLWDFLVLSVLGAVLSSLFVCAFTVAVAWAAARFRWDLDAIAAPLVTLAGDVSGVPCLALVAVLAGRGAASTFLGVPFLLAGAAAAAWGLFRLRARMRRIFRESLPLLGFVGLLDLGAGAVLQGQEDKLLRYGVFLIVLPSFLEACGGFGGMFASRLASKIHLGSVEARSWPESVVLVDSTLVYLFAALIFPAMAIIGQSLAHLTGQTTPGWGGTLQVVLTAGVVATTLTLLVAYYTALATVRFGLDPDNHAVPMVTSSMDLMGTLCLAAGLAVWGVR